MSITTYIEQEGWTLTFTLYDANGDIVSADGRVKCILNPVNIGSDNPQLLYVLGSDSELTQSGSGIYILDDPAIPPNEYDVEFGSDGTNKERKRTVIKIKQELET